MSSDPHAVREIPAGTPVVGYDGARLGVVREAQPHFILVDRPDEHTDLEVPVHAIVGFEDGVLRVSITRESATEVDAEETAHRLVE